MQKSLTVLWQDRVNDRAVEIDIFNASEEPKKLLDLLLDKGLLVPHICSGGGSCGTCMVEILKNDELLNEPDEHEQDMLNSRGWGPKARLSCQCYFKTNSLGGSDKL